MTLCRAVAKHAKEMRPAQRARLPVCERRDFDFGDHSDKIVELGDDQESDDKRVRSLRSGSRGRNAQAFPVISRDQDPDDIPVSAEEGKKVQMDNEEKKLNRDGNTVAAPKASSAASSSSIDDSQVATRNVNRRVLPVSALRSRGFVQARSAWNAIEPPPFVYPIENAP